MNKHDCPKISVPRGLGEIITLFGDIEKYIITKKPGRQIISPLFEKKYITAIKLPFAIPLAGHEDIMVAKMRCHRLLASRFALAFETIKARGLGSEIRSFGGCYNFRRKRNGKGYSTHSWGIAIDLNTQTNQVGAKGDMSPEVVAIFKDLGFIWGGDWKGRAKDPMHFQYCTGY